MPSSAPGSIAIIGAGVAGCALVAHLRRGGYAGHLSLWEAGRGPGGRAGTRRSRADEQLGIDHGAPLLNITAEPEPVLLKPLLAGGWLKPWAGPVAMLEGESRLNIGRPDAMGVGHLFRGHGGMDQLSAGLLSLAGDGHVQTHYGTLVRYLNRPKGGPWQLLDGDRSLLGEADWLVLTGTLLAHPRSKMIFGWSAVPLKEVSAQLNDLQLEHVLTTLAGMRFEARSNLMLMFAGEAALPWRSLPFQLINFDAAAQQRWGLRRVSVQPMADGRCAVVAHSSNAFAADHLDVYGSASSVARLLDLPPDQGREDTVVLALGRALLECFAPWIGDMDLTHAAPQLMRWGAAFPVAPGLPTELAFCRNSCVGFCGDFLAGVGFGRIEGALRSSERLGKNLLAAVSGSS
jgi:predicted NAD/FAD-dependent oxidoreductase